MRSGVQGGRSTSPLKELGMVSIITIIGDKGTPGAVIPRLPNTLGKGEDSETPKSQSRSPEMVVLTPRNGGFCQYLACKAIVK